MPHLQNRLVQRPEAARRDLSDQNQTGKRGPTDRHKIPDKRGENRGRCFHPKAQHRTRPNFCPPNLAQASLSLVTGLQFRALPGAKLLSKSNYRRLIPRKIARFKPCIFHSILTFRVQVGALAKMHPRFSSSQIADWHATRRGAIPTRFGGVSATIILPGTGGPRVREPMFPNSIPRRRGRHDYRIGDRRTKIRKFHPM